jgi:hypothetical protein
VHHSSSLYARLVVAGQIAGFAVAPCKPRCPDPTRLEFIGILELHISQTVRIILFFAIALVAVVFVANTLVAIVFIAIVFIAVIFVAAITVRCIVDVPFRVTLLNVQQWSRVGVLNDILI